MNKKKDTGNTPMVKIRVELQNYINYCMLIGNINIRNIEMLITAYVFSSVNASFNQWNIVLIISEPDCTKSGIWHMFSNHSISSYCQAFVLSVYIESTLESCIFVVMLLLETSFLLLFYFILCSLYRSYIITK